MAQRFRVQLSAWGWLVASAACTSAVGYDAEDASPEACEPYLDCAPVAVTTEPVADAAPTASYASCEGVATNPQLVEQREPLPLAAHRALAVACETTRPCNHVQMGVGPIVCRAHADCSAGANGRCQSRGYECSYDTCFTDDDCKPDQLCDCAGGNNGAHRCLPAGCRTDADCADGRGCSPSRAVLCYNLQRVVGYFCHTPSDECTTDRDCLGACVFDASRSRWRCTDAQCTVP